MIPIRYIDAGPMPQLTSISGATAPGRGAAAIGQAVEGLGEQASRVVQQVREVKDSGEMAQLFAGLNTDAAEFERELLSREDTDQWAGDWETRVKEDYQTRINDSGMSPRAKATANMRLLDWSSQRAIGFQKTALLKEVEMGKVRLGAALNLYAETDQWDEYDRTIKEADPSILSSAQGEKLIQDGKFRRSDQELIEQAESNPHGTLQSLEDPKFHESNPHTTNAGREQAKTVARRAATQGNYAMNDFFANGVATGAINRPEQVDSMPQFSNASPALKSRYKEALTREITEAERLRVKTPEYQEMATGRLKALIDNYEPAKDDGTYAWEMDQLVGVLQDTPAKAVLQKQLKERKEEKLSEYESTADIYRDQLKHFFDGGGFGYGSTKQPVKDILRDGILKDRDKLLKLGLSGEQIDTFIDIEDPLQQVAPFREAMKKRAGFVAPSLSEYDQEAFALIESGNEGEVEFPDQKAKMEAERKYGSALREFEGWRKTHPDAKDDDFQKVLLHILGPQSQEQFDDLFIPGENEATDQLLPPKK